jgi:hypothetical protein
MVELRISADWMHASTGEPEISATAGMLSISVDNIHLTRSQDVWAKTVRENVFVSAYPLAMWLASSWWRLNYEPLPPQQPGHDWRMAHELGAANHGYVWPRVVFIPDGEVVHVWAGASMSTAQSVQYLQGLDAPAPVSLQGFQRSIQRFVQSVISRLDARELVGTDLANMWAVLQEDLADPEAVSRRKLEAELGFDPEECPTELLDAALRWKAQVGDAALSELAPAISSAGLSPDLTTLRALASSDGVVGSPTVSPNDIEHLERGAPWERAVHDAQALRRRLGNLNAPLLSSKLHDLLGLSNSAVADWTPPSVRSPVAVAIPTTANRMKFVPRKRNAVGQRFELARFLSEYLRASDHGDIWLASTDLSTSRQKYQRAFAAEFLCPLDSLLSFLDGDFSSYAMEEAAVHFEVSDQVVSNLLLNNGLIHHHWAQHLPYAMAA